jgi:hypothetical protein
MEDISEVSCQALIHSGCLTAGTRDVNQKGITTVAAERERGDTVEKEITENHTSSAYPVNNLPDSTPRVYVSPSLPIVEHPSAKLGVESQGRD